MLTNLPIGTQTLVAQGVGYKPQEKAVKIEAGKSIEINFNIEEDIMHLDDVVVTGTRTFKRRTETPVIVNIPDNKSLDAVQACNISEGLRFQPGLRVETDCQTCSYTQLRMNGLGGGYSQILINGRPVFSPLIGLYGMEQTTKNGAVFLQSDWKLSNALALLTGIRADKHNLLNRIILSPMASILYRLKEYTQFRLTWGTGFRAPQAFDTDMHIAFAGGGISRISLDPHLKEERSNSFSGSVNYDKATEYFIYGFTMEGFYTKLNGTFHLQPVGKDEFGEQFKKQNGPGATVKGITLEGRANYSQKVQLEAGFTWQESHHSEAVENIGGLEAKREFLRTPNHYGYAILSFFPAKNLNVSISGIHTGKMLLAKFSPNVTLQPNEYRTSPSFTEISAKGGYTFELPFLYSGLEIFAGVKNLSCFGSLMNRSPLIVAQGIGSAVGQQININIFRIDEKSIVTGFPDNFFPLFARDHLNGFQRLYAERLRRIIV